MSFGLVECRDSTATHVGLVRSTNQDSYYCNAAAGIWVVADGMGGHYGGERASAAIVERISNIAGHRGFVERLSAVRAAITDANQDIFDQAQAEGRQMGSTVIALVMGEGRYAILWVGDSRAYLCRSGASQQLSDDHSAVRELVRNGQLTQAEARNSPMRNIILRALGLKPNIEPLIWNAGLPLQDGDILVMCSDGLTDGVDDDAIAATVSRLPPGDACRALIDAAMQAGGHDNISVGVFAVRGRPIQEQDMDATRRIDPVNPAG